MAAPGVKAAKPSRLHKHLATGRYPMGVETGPLYQTLYSLNSQGPKLPESLNGSQQVVFKEDNLLIGCR